MSIAMLLYPFSTPCGAVNSTNDVMTAVNIRLLSWLAQSPELSDVITYVHDNTQYATAKAYLGNKRTITIIEDLPTWLQSNHTHFVTSAIHMNDVWITYCQKQAEKPLLPLLGRNLGHVFTSNETKHYFLPYQQHNYHYPNLADITSQTHTQHNEPGFTIWRQPSHKPRHCRIISGDDYLNINNIVDSLINNICERKAFVIGGGIRSSNNLHKLTELANAIDADLYRSSGHTVTTQIPMAGISGSSLNNYQLVWTFGVSHCEQHSCSWTHVPTVVAVNPDKRKRNIIHTCDVLLATTTNTILDAVKSQLTCDVTTGTEGS